MRNTSLVLWLGAVSAVVGALIVSPVSSDVTAANQAAPALNCDLTQYKASTGLTTALDGNVLTVSWNGQGASQLRARFAIDAGTPTIRDLSVRRGGGEWAMLGQNLTPEYQVTTGRRRMSNDQANAFASLGIDVTPELLEKHKWYAFWDAPLSVPGYYPATAGGRGGGAGAPAQTQAMGQGGTTPEQVAALQSGSRGRPGYNPSPNPPGFTGGRGIPLPRTKEEIRRGVSAFSASSCEVKSDGASLAVTFPGMKLGIFDGNLRFTVYRGTNLLQMDAIARTSEPSVAYKYDAGLKGFSTATMPRVTWRDTGGHPQQHQFGGPKAIGLSAIRASNRLLLAEGPRGSIATFPPPHTFFFTREVDVNLGYVFYRNDGGGTYSIGVTMPEAESDTFPQYEQNYALYNAPPGTWQKMQMFFYLSPEPAEATRQAALAFTHEDVFKPVPGYKTFVNHFHLRVVDRMRVGGFDTPLQDLIAMKAIGLNVIGLSDFHADSLAANDHGPLRFRDQKDYAEASRRLSDKDFLVVPWEEPSVAFGGHYNIMWPKNVLLVEARIDRRRTGRPARSRDYATAVRGERSDLREGLPYGRRREGATASRCRGRLLVSRAPAHEIHSRFPRRNVGHQVSAERSLPRGGVQAGHGPGQLGADDVRVAVLRRRRHDEQHVRGHGHPSEARHRRHRHLPQESRRRHLRELPGELLEARHRTRARPGLESGAEGDARG